MGASVTNRASSFIFIYKNRYNILSYYILQILSGALRGNHGRKSAEYLSIRQCSSNSGKSSVSIGDVTIAIKDAKHPELVPTKYMSKDTPQSFLRHLQWIMQKDALGQDVFLIGTFNNL